MTDTISSFRHRQSGATLIEVLVILALIGVMSGAVALSFSALNKSESVRQEVEFLAVKLRTASIHALTYGAPYKLVWSKNSYRFFGLSQSKWVPHTVAELGRAHMLPSGLSLRISDTQQLGDEPSFVVGADLIPQPVRVLKLKLSNAKTAWSVWFDGADAKFFDNKLTAGVL